MIYIFVIKCRQPIIISGNVIPDKGEDKKPPNEFIILAGAFIIY